MYVMPDDSRPGQHPWLMSDLRETNVAMAVNAAVWWQQSIEEVASSSCIWSQQCLRYGYCTVTAVLLPKEAPGSLHEWLTSEYIYIGTTKCRRRTPQCPH